MCLQKNMISLILVCTGFGCGQHAPEPPPSNNVRKVFGATISDNQVDLNHSTPLKPTDFMKDQRAQISVLSQDWLELSDQMMEAGDVINSDFGKRLSLTGHKLSNAFYEETKAFTVMTAESFPAGSPYLEIAYFYADPVLSLKIKDMIGDAKDTAIGAASSIQMNVPTITSDSNPNVIIDTVVTGLQKFQVQFLNIKQQKEKKSGQSNLVSDQIYQKVQGNFIQDLSNFKKATEKLSTETVQMFMAKLRDSLNALSEFPESQRRKLVEEVDRGREVALRVERLKNSQDSLQLITDLWSSKQIKSIFPDSGKKFFQGFTREQIMAMVTRNAPQVVAPEVWEQLKDRTDYSFLDPEDLLALTINNRGKILSNSEWSIVKGHLDRFMRETLKTSELKNFVERLSGKHDLSDDQALLVLVDGWLSLSFRVSLFPDLRKIFLEFSDGEIQAMGDNSTPNLFFTGHFKLGSTRWGILDHLDQFGAPAGQKISQAQALQNLKDKFNGTIVSTTQSKVNKALLPIATSLGDQIIGALGPELDNQLSSASEIATSTFRKFGRFYIGTQVFGVPGLRAPSAEDNANNESADKLALIQHPLPLLEKNKIRFVKTTNPLEAVEVKEDNQTSPELLGISLSNMYYRLKGLQTYENISPESQPSAALQFQAFNKLLALAGFKTPTLQIHEGLAVPITPGHADEKLELKNYRPEVVAFGFPDRIRLKGSFKLDSISERSPSFSLSGQMELLRGFANMMKYSKPWRESSFDLGLSKLRVPEAPMIQAFSKEDFFNLSVGLSSVILKNIPTKMLGIITANKDFVDATQVDDFKKLNPIGATLSDYTPQGLSHNVDSASLAKAMIAIAEFLTETSDIARATSEALSDPATQKMFAEGRTQLRELLTGIAVFSVGTLMQADGGFVRGYNFDKKKVFPEPRQLNDQILMQEALTKVGVYVDSDFFLYRSLDNFFFLNSNFWDPKLGFYEFEEGDTSGKLRLVHVARLLKNLQRFKKDLLPFLTQSPNLSSSYNQILDLEKFWDAHFFSSQMDQLNSLFKVLDFSL